MSFRGADAVLGREADEYTLDDRVQMEVMVTVDVVEGKSGDPKSVELSTHFRGKLRARGSRAKDPNALSIGIGWEATA